MELAQSSRPIERVFRPRHDYLPGTTIFREIDLDLVARELRLEELGERDGKAELPPSDSTAITATETAIGRRVRHYWDEAAQGVRRAQESLASRWSSLTADAEIDTLLSEPKAVRSTMNDVAREGRDQLEALYHDWKDHHQHLAEFREAEVISRPPLRPKSTALKLAVVMMAVALELAINVSAFAGGEEFGLAGAFLKVLAIPFLNIGVAGVLIYAVARHVVRRQGWARALGLLGFALTFAWVLLFNLTISHWRDSLGTQMSLEAGSSAFRAMIENPLGIANLNSWLLFAAGFSAGLLGGYDGWIWTDPHPGYGRRVEALAKAELLYNQRRAWYVARLGHIAAGATKALRDALVKAETSSTRRPELAAQLMALEEDVDRYRAHLQAVGEDLVIRYREANARSRSTPPPQHHQRELAIELPRITLPALQSPAEARSVPGLLAAAMEQITAAKDEACAGLKTLAERSEHAG